MNRLADLEFTDSERNELELKIRQAVKKSGLDGILALDSGNFTYLTRGVLLPFTDQDILLPSLVFLGSDKADDFIICPPEIPEVLRNQRWTGAVESYSINDGKASQGLVKKAGELLSGKKHVGYDSAKISLDMFSRLQEALPKAEFSDTAVLLRDLRAVKTAGEIRLLEIAARLSDRAFISALNHAEGSAGDILNYYLWEFTERIRVHVGEFGGSLTGSLSAMQGGKARLSYAKLDLHERFIQNAFIRAEWTNHSFGYWADNAKTVFIGGTPGVEAQKNYKDNITLKKAAVDALKAGLPASRVFKAVQDESIRLSIPFRKEAGAGHGVGTSEREHPYFDGFDETPLKAGMVVTVGVYTYGDSGELLCSKDTYEIQEAGVRLLSWYKSYDDLYCMYGSSARHG